MLWLDMLCSCTCICGDNQPDNPCVDGNALRQMVNGVVEHETLRANPDPVAPAGHETVAWAVGYTTGQHYERGGETED